VTRASAEPLSGRPTSRVRGILRRILAGALVLHMAESRLRCAPSSSEIAFELRSFATCGSVLYVAAHPDDENTQLIAYLARGRGYRTAYLSLTRGDGGQNILGPDLGDTLGVIRTQELLAARSVDGGRQFFSRARDFGYSKDYLQALSKWDRQAVVSDMVRVIRTFRPDVILTRFSPEPGGTHGHHTASAVLALEAFKLAGDPAAFPEQLTSLKPWKARRLMWNGWGQRGPSDTPAGGLHISIDGNDPVTGATFAALAAKSRSMHGTQGFANFTVATMGSGPKTEAFFLLDGEAAKTDIMEGVDTTWNRYPGGDAIAKQVEEISKTFNPENPQASVAYLMALRRRLGAIEQTPLIEEKRQLLDHILQSCLALEVEAGTSRAEVVPGEKVVLHERVRAPAGSSATWVGVRYPTLGKEEHFRRPCAPEGAAADVEVTLPRDTPLSQPYWLRQEPLAGMFRVADPSLIGLPENPPVVPLEFIFDIGGEQFVVRTQAMALGEHPRRLEAIAPVSLGLSDPVVLLHPGGSRTVEVQVLAARPAPSARVSLEAPEGWSVSPAEISVRLPQSGDKATCIFTITAPNRSESATLQARCVVGGTVSTTGRQELGYTHVPPILLQPPARLRAVSLDLEKRGDVVGYIAGAGDSLVPAMEQMGYRVVVLKPELIDSEHLKGLDAVVIGVRAFNTVKELPARFPALLAYVEAGGTLIEQYNTPATLENAVLGPYPLILSRDLPKHRVTDEKSAVTLLLPEHPAFHVPNPITGADFDGWVQERGLNFPSEWDTTHYHSLLACSDPGEAPLTSGLLASRYGRGWYVYTGLSFFRQLPAGVPGSYRLFANLLSLGK
jgi:LmbE family N-acetylglucosaminyl deacetylase